MLQGHLRGIKRRFLQKQVSKHRESNPRFEIETSLVSKRAQINIYGRRVGNISGFPRSPHVTNPKPCDLQDFRTPRVALFYFGRAKNNVTPFDGPISTPAPPSRFFVFPEVSGTGPLCFFFGRVERGELQ